jgi:hypothetical protein
MEEIMPGRLELEHDSPRMDNGWMLTRIVRTENDVCGLSKLRDQLLRA